MKARQFSLQTFFHKFCSKWTGGPSFSCFFSWVPCGPHGRAVVCASVGRHQLLHPTRCVFFQYLEEQVTADRPIRRGAVVCRVFLGEIFLHLRISLHASIFDCFFIVFRLLYAISGRWGALFPACFSELTTARWTTVLGCAVCQTLHFPGGESDMTPCRSTSKTRQNLQMKINNKNSTQASRWRYNLTVRGF